ncbi:MAG: DUF4388 domain-containing protein [Acidobacteriota bacterium]
MSGGESDGLVLSGRLEESSFADLMKSLTTSRETAVLTLSNNTLAKTIYVQDGRIVFAASTDLDDRLGECMLREGMIGVAQYDESAKRIRPGRKLGTVLVELGYVTPTELVKGVKAQVEHVVSSLFSWRSGDYKLEMRSFDRQDMIQLNISTENLVFGGVKSGAGWSQVLRGLGGSMDAVLDRAPDADSRLYKLDLSDDEAHVYSLANGRLSVAQICAMSYLHDYATAVTLWGLACCGILTLVSSKDAESLFREQVAEFELQELRDRVESFNRILRVACEKLSDHVRERMSTFLDETMSEVVDEHHDILRDVDISGYEVDPELVVENLSEVETGRRRKLLDSALDGLLVALLLKVKLEVSAELERELSREVTSLRAQ